MCLLPCIISPLDKFICNCSPPPDEEKTLKSNDTTRYKNTKKNDMHYSLSVIIQVFFHSVEETKHGSHKKTSLTLYISTNVKWLTSWEGRKEKKATYNNHNHMHHNVLGDVGMRYSLAVMFHVFPVWRGAKTGQSWARITDTAHIVGACGKEWDSPNEVGGRRKRQHITTTTTCITMC